MKEINKWINKVIHGDCIDVMNIFPSNSINCIITDPPYFLPATHYQSRTKFSRNFCDLGILEHFIKNVFKEMIRILKDDGIIYIFCDGQSYPIFYYHLYSHCKKERPLIWNKCASLLGYTWRHQHEIILFAEMSNAKPVNTGDGDIIKCKAVKIKERLHPAEKPIELLSKLIKKSTKEGDIILDPFAGSGSTLVSAKNLNRNFIGIDVSKEYCKIAKDRIDNIIKLVNRKNINGNKNNVDWKEVFKH